MSNLNLRQIFIDVFEPRPFAVAAMPDEEVELIGSLKFRTIRGWDRCNISYGLVEITRNSGKRFWQITQDKAHVDLVALSSELLLQDLSKDLGFEHTEADLTEVLIGLELRARLGDYFEEQANGYRLGFGRDRSAE